MQDGITRISRTRPSDPAGATPPKETPEQRRTRRETWGREWGAVMHEHSQRIKTREGR